MMRWRQRRCRPELMSSSGAPAELVDLFGHHSPTLCIIASARGAVCSARLLGRGYSSAFLAAGILVVTKGVAV